MNDHTMETYKSMVEISVVAMKTLILINGAAVIAILTFIGTDNGRYFAPHAGVPLSGFIAGVVFTFLTFVFSYATQFALLNESINSTNYRGPRHMTFVAIALVFVVLSLVAFIVGCVSSVWALTSCGN